MAAMSAAAASTVIIVGVSMGRAQSMGLYLPQVTKALGDHGISLSAIQQRESEAGQFVPVVITTHLARQGDMSAALKAIDALSSIKSPTACIRVIDQPKEFAGG